MDACAIPHDVSILITPCGGVGRGQANPLEGLKDEHAAAATGARLGQHIGRGRIGFAGIALLGDRRLHGEQRAHPGQIIRAGTAGQKPVMADAVKALRQHVGQETADELARLERHGLVTAGSLDPVVLVFEGDAGLVRRDQAPVGDGDAVSVARQVR